ncbi:hypothetical protein BO71DRAFT_431614 [Aspergillus ellipticus CBS 707.79]|uniref:Meiotically up-regulated protein Msb1/Mug8 domain-containing protein n=1 Tax=Aspergillus ellipticus CBS 707.79 TaxID=1448320 RepID=A0A319EP68_9EURO|nr:hypothetical protein BO71DRAFT_431614 [Aspergillus ellipticus CBS 707.79]
MPFFTRVFRSKDANAAKKSKAPAVEDKGPAKPTWTDAWQRTEVAPDEVQGLLRGCTQELKARALQTPFLLLPFRPSSDASAARSFIRNFFNRSVERGSPLDGDELAQELRLSDPMVLCSVLKWCWSRLPGGVVTWEAYELFKVGEQDSQFARDAFSTFIPISVDSDARSKIVFDFFDLLAAVAAHGKSNGLGGRKLSRYAGWWAFEHSDIGKGFEAAYKNWASAADAASHLFFAYLRSLSPDPRMNTISTLPIALQSLVQATEYPPETPTLLQVSTTKVVMIVDNVSPTPFSLLRRAKNFEYRDSDSHLQEFASFEEPTRALTDECLRVLKCISSINSSSEAVESDPTTSTREASWSRFEDIGFGGALGSDMDDDSNAASLARSEFGGGLRSAPQSGGGDFGRPTTPSWADFMSSGFSNENGLKGPAPLLLPPDKVLPPLSSVRVQSSQSHKRSLNDEPSTGPGELASIATLDLDDSFWWVWISSLAVEESVARKAVFGRCALLETIIKDTKWLVLEEQVRGAAPEPEPGAYIVEKKRFFGFSTRKKGVNRHKSSAKKVNGVEDAYKRPDNQAPQSKTSIAPDQHARIQAAAAALQKRHREEQEAANEPKPLPGNTRYSKTNSVMTLQPAILNEASHAMKWATNYDKNTYRTAYLSNNRAGTGAATEEASSDVPSTPTSPTASTSARQAPLPLAKDTPSSSPKPAVPVKESPVHENVESRNGSTSPLPDLSATESIPKQSMDSDSGRKVKKRTGNGGFKSMFGTVKKKNDLEAKPPMKPSGVERPAGSAVAAARAALEDRARAAQEHPPRPSTNGKSTLKKKPVPVAAPAEVSTAAVEAPAQPKAPEPAETNASLEVPKPTGVQTDEPQIRRQAEYDALSRIDTKERTAADQEFSRFDQGPLADQPAFVPESPVSEKITEKPASMVSAVEEIPVEEEEPSPAPSPAPKPVTTSYDRWAQIRQNAAERAAQMEAKSDHSDDDDNTSEEESFESRAARIKARVAELTGNMQAASQS